MDKIKITESSHPEMYRKMAEEGRALGKEAASDTWMIGGKDGAKKHIQEAIEDGADTMQEVICHFEEGWEETDHFMIKYRTKLQSFCKESFPEIEEKAEYPLETKIDLVREGLTYFWEVYYDALAEKRGIDLWRMAKEATENLD